MAANLSRLKSTQYLLICRAGLAVSAETEAASEELKRDMLQEFKDAVAKFSLSDDLKGYPTDIQMRSKNFIARICKIFFHIDFFCFLWPDLIGRVNYEFRGFMFLETRILGHL